MPKMKTNRGAAKRFRRTGSGKFKRAQSFRRHILTKKSTKRKRNLTYWTTVDKSNEKNVKLLLNMK